MFDFLSQKPNTGTDTSSTPAKTKKTFNETGFGKFFNNAGGVEGIFNLGTNILGAIKGKNKNSGSADTGGFNYAPPPPAEDSKILGMPTIAFGAVALMVVLVVIFAFTARGSAPAA